MQRDRCVLQPRELEVVREQPAQAGVRDEVRRRPRKPSSPASGRVGNTSSRDSDRHSSARAVTPARSGRAAIQPPLRAPTDVPTIRSGAISASARPSSIPTWIEPRLAPPESTNAVAMTPTQRCAAGSHVPNVAAATLRQPVWAGSRGGCRRRRGGAREGGEASGIEDLHLAVAELDELAGFEVLEDPVDAVRRPPTSAARTCWLRRTRPCSASRTSSDASWAESPPARRSRAGPGPRPSAARWTPSIGAPGGGAAPGRATA